MVSKGIGWDRRLAVVVEGRGLVGCYCCLTKREVLSAPGAVRSGAALSGVGEDSPCASSRRRRFAPDGRSRRRFQFSFARRLSCMYAVR